MAPLTLRAPAKVNLALSVGPPDASGMHPIASWMVAVAWGDDVALRRTTGGGCTLSRRWAADAPHTPAIGWPAEQDLGWRAHAALAAAAGRSLPTAIEVVKRVPPGAGLGGGSGDAAAVLVGLRRLHGLTLDDDALKRVGETLGSDVPFAVDAVLGRPSAVVTGRGERVEPAPLASTLHLVLVLPPLHCPTGAVYRALDAGAAARLDEPRVRALAAAAAGGPGPTAALAQPTTPPAEPRVASPHPPTGATAQAGSPAAAPSPDARTAVGRPAAYREIDFSHNDMCQKVDFSAAGGLFNDLAAPAMRVTAGLRGAVERVAAVVGPAVHVTGSGAAMFVLAGDGAEARALAERVRREAGLPAVATMAVAAGGMG